MVVDLGESCPEDITFLYHRRRYLMCSLFKVEVISDQFFWSQSKGIKERRSMKFPLNRDPRFYHE